MDFMNAIAKVRFGSAKPQRIQLTKTDSCQVEMLCMESGQQLSVRSGRWLYYVIAGHAAITAKDVEQKISAGHLATTAAGEKHQITACGEQRLICLAVSC